MSHLAIGGHAGPIEVLGGLPEEADPTQRTLYEVSRSMCAGCAEKPRFAVGGAFRGGRFGGSWGLPTKTTAPMWCSGR